MEKEGFEENRLLFTFVDLSKRDKGLRMKIRARIRARLSDEG
jgi:hypothetical protein